MSARAAGATWPSWRMARDACTAPTPNSATADAGSRPYTGPATTNAATPQNRCDRAFGDGFLVDPVHRCIIHERRAATAVSG